MHQDIRAVEVADPAANKKALETRALEGTANADYCAGDDIFRSVAGVCSCLVKTT